MKYSSDQAQSSLEIAPNSAAISLFSSQLRVNLMVNFWAERSVVVLSGCSDVFRTTEAIETQASAVGGQRMITVFDDDVDCTCPLPAATYDTRVAHPPRTIVDCIPAGRYFFLWMPHN